MIVNKVFASYTFRFLSAYVASLSVAVMIILVIVYLTLSRGYFDELNRSIIDEQVVFSDIYQQRGVAGALEYIERQMASYDRNRFFYLVVDENYQKIVGNLDAWPKYTDYGGGWLSFELDVLELDDEGG